MFLSILFFGGTVIYLRREKQNPVRERLQKGTFTPAVQDDAGTGSMFAGIAMKAGKAVSVKGTSSELQQKMVKAGYSSPSAMPIFLGVKFFLLIIALMLSGFYVSIAELTIKISSRF